jgi:hypothetical protein
MRSYTTRFDTWHTLLTSEKYVESSCIDNESIAPYNSHVISSTTRYSNTRRCGNGRRPDGLMRARPDHVYARICDISQLTSKLADMRRLPDCASARATGLDNQLAAATASRWISSRLIPALARSFPEPPRSLPGLARSFPGLQESNHREA